jgi:hypothetical protein
MLWFVLFGAFAAAFSAATASSEDPDRSQSAIQFLEKACASGEKVEIVGGGDGGISLFKKGVTGEFRFSQKEVHGFVDVLDDRIKSEQADKIRECMKPYVGKILTVILGNET